MKIVSLLFVVLAYSLVPAVSQEKLLSRGEMPILAWYGIPPEETTPERFREVKESGITMNLTTYPDAASMARALDVARKVGITMIVSCPELKTDPASTVRRFRSHPATAGYMLRDEPGRKDFPELGEWARAIQAVDNRHFCYLNLFPNYASEQQLGTATYTEHVDLFIKEVPVPIISFDHYPVTGDSLRPGWYENLEIIAAAARKAGKPFWAFALTVAHGPYPVPTLAQLRLQVFSDLAYGAQGIQYFTYWTPGGTEWDFHHGPIGDGGWRTEDGRQKTVDGRQKTEDGGQKTEDRGRRTEVWDRMQQVNTEIKALSPVFKGAKVISVSHTGEVIPRGTVRPGTLPVPVKKLETIGTGAVVSVLENGNDQFLVVVNRDFLKPMQLTTEFGPGVKRVLKDGTLVPAESYTATLEVDPGDVAVFTW